MVARSVPVHRYKKKIVIRLGVKVEDKFIIYIEIGDQVPTANNIKILAMIFVCYI